MLLLDKFFSTIKNAISDAADILEISGASPPAAALDTIEGTNRYIYDELQLVTNSVLYPCRVEYHTAYDFRHLDIAGEQGFPFFVEKEDGLCLVHLASQKAITYSFSSESVNTYDVDIASTSSMSPRHGSQVRDIYYNTETEEYEVSVYVRRASPPYDWYFAIWKYTTSFVLAKYETLDNWYYRGFNTSGLYGVGNFKWQPFFNMQYIDGLFWVSSGHHVFVFDESGELKRRIFLNNPFLIGEEFDNSNLPIPGIREWGKYAGQKSFIYENDIYVANTFGDVEIYQIT